MYNPIEEAFEETDFIEKKPNDMREGVILIFHGAPNTSKDVYYFLA